MRIIFLHGFASSAASFKAQYLRPRLAAIPAVTFHAFDFNPTPLDFAHMTVTGMINRLRQYLLLPPPAAARPEPDADLVLIGSSLGGLVATQYARRFPGVARLVLLAPVLAYRSWATEQGRAAWETQGRLALEHYAFGQNLPLHYAFHLDGQQYREAAPPACPTLIFHGRQDESVPIDGSRQYAARYPEAVQLVEMDAGHSLNDQLGAIWRRLPGWLGLPPIAAGREDQP